MMNKEEAKNFIGQTAEQLVQVSSNLLKVLNDCQALCGERDQLITLQSSINISSAILAVGGIIAEFLPEKENQNA